MGGNNATMRLSIVSPSELATAREVPSMRRATGSIVQRIRGRRNRMLAYGLWQAHGGICQRCSSPIDPKLSGMHPRGLTIGHIVPLARGGTNDGSNLGPEHRSCNLSAGVGELRPMPRIVEP